MTRPIWLAATAVAAALVLAGCQAPLGRSAAAPRTSSPTEVPAVPTLNSPLPTHQSATPLAVPTPLPLPESFGELDPNPWADPVPERLAIPRIDLDTPVTTIGVVLAGGQPVWDTASHSVGYHRGTGRPGQPGNVVLSGHISSLFRGNVFKRLPQLEIGDAIVLTAGSGSFIYQVVNKKIVTPSAVEVMEPTEDETLTLITCIPEGLYTHRLIVQARRA